MSYHKALVLPTTRVLIFQIIHCHLKNLNISINASKYFPRLINIYQLPSPHLYTSISAHQAHTRLVDTSIREQRAHTSVLVLCTWKYRKGLHQSKLSCREEQFQSASLNRRQFKSQPVKRMYTRVCTCLCVYISCVQRGVWIWLPIHAGASSGRLPDAGFSISRGWFSWPSLNPHLHSIVLYDDEENNLARMDAALIRWDMIIIECTEMKILF